MQYSSPYIEEHMYDVSNLAKDRAEYEKRQAAMFAKLPVKKKTLLNKIMAIVLNF